MKLEANFDWKNLGSNKQLNCSSSYAFDKLQKEQGIGKKKKFVSYQNGALLKTSCLVVLLFWRAASSWSSLESRDLTCLDWQRMGKKSPLLPLYCSDSCAQFCARINPVVWAAESFLFEIIKQLPKGDSGTVGWMGVVAPSCWQHIPNSLSLQGSACPAHTSAAAAEPLVSPAHCWALGQQVLPRLPSLISSGRKVEGKARWLPVG